MDTVSLQVRTHLRVAPEWLLTEQATALVWRAPGWPIVPSFQVGQCTYELRAQGQLTQKKKKNTALRTRLCVTPCRVAVIANSLISLAGWSMTEKWTITLSQAEVFVPDHKCHNQIFDRGHFASECRWCQRSCHGCKSGTDASTETWDSEANKC